MSDTTSQDEEMVLMKRMFRNIQKRFWVFAGHNYYPSGGLSDFVESYDTFDEAYNSAKSNKKFGDFVYYEYDWWQILDIETKIVCSGKNRE